MKNVRISKEAREGEGEQLDGVWVQNKPSINQWWAAEKNMNQIVGMELPEGWGSMSDDLKALSFSQKLVGEIERRVAIINEEVERLNADPFSKVVSRIHTCRSMMRRINTIGDALYWRKAYPMVQFLGATTVHPHNQSIKAYTEHIYRASTKTGFTLRPIIPQVVAVALEKAQLIGDQFQRILDMRETKSFLGNNARQLKREQERKENLEGSLKDWPTDEWTANEAALNAWLDLRPAFLRGCEPEKVVDGMQIHTHTASQMARNVKALESVNKRIEGIETKIKEREAFLAEHLGGEEE